MRKLRDGICLPKATTCPAMFGIEIVRSERRRARADGAHDCELTLNDARSAGFCPSDAPTPAPTPLPMPTTSTVSDAPPSEPTTASTRSETKHTESERALAVRLPADARMRAAWSGQCLTLVRALSLIHI